MTSELVGAFWADIERHHPEVDSLQLPDEIATAWKLRAQTVVERDGTSRPRRNYHGLLFRVRSFYLDIQDWASEDPSWAQCAAPSPVRRSDTRGEGKVKRRATAQIHQRIRERVPHLPVLVETAERYRGEQAELLAAATEVTADETSRVGACAATSPRTTCLAGTAALTRCRFRRPTSTPARCLTWPPARTTRSGAGR